MKIVIEKKALELRSENIEIIDISGRQMRKMFFCCGSKILSGIIVKASNASALHAKIFPLEKSVRNFSKRGGFKDYPITYSQSDKIFETFETKNDLANVIYDIRPTVEVL